MQLTAAYVPEDRRAAPWAATPVRRVTGTVLFVDISGFTPLTSAFVAALGRRKGADATTHRLNTVYTALIACIHRYRGAIIGFSGDGMLCWYDATDGWAGPAARRALAAAAAVQETMADLSTVEITGQVSIRLGVKTALASGEAVRCLVGDPAVQRIDVLAGATVDRSAAAERMAAQGETIVDRATAELTSLRAADVVWRDADKHYGQVQPAILPEVGSETGSDVLPGTAPATAPATTFDSSAAWEGSWLLPALRAELADGETQFLGELRPATALFVRLDGLDFDTDPEAPAQMDAYVCWVQSVLERHEGALIQLTTGDKGSYIYAAFGAPIAHDDDLQRAAAAARMLLDPPVSLDYRPNPQIGLAAGQMRVGAYGSQSRCTYGVQGAAVNRAAQLMLQAAPAQIVTDQTTAARLGPHHGIDPIGEARLKGQPESIPLFAVGPQRRVTPLTATTYFDTRLRGRDDLLTALTHQWQQVHAHGQGRVVRIVGEAGMGKSHLLAEFIGRIKEADSALVAVGSGRSTERNRLFYAARQIARWMLGLDQQNRTAVAEQIAHVTAYLGALNKAWLPRLPLLADLLAIPIKDNGLTAALSPRQRREALTDLVTEIVTAVAAHAPMVLVIDDVQRIDEASLDLLGDLARGLEQSPVLMIIAQRPAPECPPQVQAALAAIEPQHRLSVDPLDFESSTAVIADRLDGQVSPLVNALIGARAQGSPLMIEALIDALRAAEQLVHSPAGAWELAPAMLDQLRRAHLLDEQTDTPQLAAEAAELELGLPDSVHGLILARVDRLPAPVRALLKVASVLGPAFDREVFQAVHAATDVGDTAGALPLPPSAEQFIHPVPGRPQRIRFRHNVTQEVLYQTLLDEQRRRLHLRAAQALESLAPDAVEKLAHHYVNSPLDSEPLRSRCLHLLDLAAGRAQREYANETALQYVDQALALEADWTRLKRKVDLLHLLGRRDEEADALAALERLPRAPAFERHYARGLYHEAVSSYDQALAAVEAALGHARSAANQEEEARALARIGLIAWRQGDYPRAAQSYEEALSILGTEAHFADEEADCHYGLGLVYRQIGRYDESHGRFERALAIYRAIGHRPHEAKTLIAIGHVEQYRLRSAVALAAYESALALYRTTGDRAGLALSMLSLAQGYRNRGDHSKARELLHEALSKYQAIGDIWSQILVWNELGIVAMMLGELPEAQALLEEGLKLSREIRDESGVAYTLCNLGQVLRDQGRLSAAKVSLTEGLSLARLQQDRYLEASYLQDLARVQLAEADLQAALATAAASSELFASLDAAENNVTNQTTAAQAYARLDQVQHLLVSVSDAISLLEEGGADAVAFPQREYLLCARLLHRHRPDEANRCADRAYDWTIKLADQISDSAVRAGYLANHPFNQTILASQYVR